MKRKNGRKRGDGKKKIPMKYIVEKKKRQQTFCKRRDGLFKRAFDLHQKTDCEILILVTFESGHVSVFSTDAFSKVRDELLQLKKDSVLYHKPVPPGYYDDETEEKIKPFKKEWFSGENYLPVKNVKNSSKAKTKVSDVRVPMKDDSYFFPSPSTLDFQNKPPLMMEMNYDF